MAEYIDVACSGCRQRIGFSIDRYPNRYKVFCSKICALEPPATVESARNDEWQFLNAYGRKPVMLGHMYNSPHGLVYKSLARISGPLPRVPETWDGLNAEVGFNIW